MWRMRAMWLTGLATAFVWTLLTPATLPAQATTNAGVRGTVADSAGVPIPAASVLSHNLSNGERWQTATDSRGRYWLEYLSVGGPYRLEVRAIGYEPAAREDLFLSLGQRYRADFALASAAVQLQEITVAAEADARINPGRTGPAQIVSGSTISRLPISGRDFSQLAILSPQVTVSPNEALSFAGQHERFNSLQIDGSTNNDLLTCSCGGIGAPLGVRPFSPESVKEIQVITASFDVRYGNFAGGLVNAVTKSGSNRFEGAVFGYYESAGLTGRDSTGSRATAFTNQEGGFVLGGPIVKDRLAFFLEAGYRRVAHPQSVPAPTSDTTHGTDSAGIGIRYETLKRFQNILQNTWGVEPGEFDFTETRARAWSGFAKLTLQLGLNSRLELSHNRPGENLDVAPFRDRGYYQLSSMSQPFRPRVDATRLTWTAAFGHRLANELIASRLSSSIVCTPRVSYPIVNALEQGGTVEAGTPLHCHGNADEQEIWELTDNLSVGLGAHRLTFGTHAELLSLSQNITGLRHGVWLFDSLDSLEQGVPSIYARDVPNPAQPAGDLADFGVRQIGLYAQDEWSPTPNLTLTAGLRMDVPFFRGTPVRNPALETELGIDNARTPSGNVLWSPRLGINWDVSRRGSTYLRGGAGLFAGRPPYFWAAELYRRTGLGSVFLFCAGDDAPAFNLNPDDQPETCANFDPGVPRASFFDPAFRFPRNLKLSLGLDQRLPWGVVGTLDLLHTRWINQFDWTDRNLTGPVGVAVGEGNRVLYGTFGPDGLGVPNRVSNQFDAVIEVKNASGDRAWSLTGQLQKKFANGTELSAAYTWTDARNRTDAPADFIFSNYALNPLDGFEPGKPLRTSFWEVPHKVTLLATMDLPLKVRFGLYYIGQSGRPFTWRVLGDVNADGVGGFLRDNDAAYVPRDSSDITLADPSQWSVLDSIIRNDTCLERQRGGIVERNSCRSPWVHDARARLTTVLPLVRGQRLELSADLFNVLKLLDGDWGQVRQHGDLGIAGLLENAGPWDDANQRATYALARDFSEPRALNQDRSRWQFQFSARYVF
jgi:hypothetical protein